jgi:hypothetical protein
MKTESVNIEKSGNDPALMLKVPMRVDPILDELWRIKAELNAAAGYDVQVLLERAAAFQVIQHHNPA